jgi:hypothetical protein
VRLNAAGWKPVIGADVKGPDWELARYGLDERSYMVACNLTNLARRAEIQVYPDEIATALVGERSSAKGFLYVPFYGGSAANVFSGGKMHVNAEVGALLVNVLEAAGKVDGEGSLSAEWEGDGCGRMTLKLVSRDFRGRVLCRNSIEGYRAEGPCAIEFKGGETVRVRYCDAALAAVADAVDSLDLTDLSKVSLRHAEDIESKEIAERFEFFFKSATLPENPMAAKKYRSPVRKTLDTGLKPFTVRLGPVEVHADDRIEFSRFARRVLNVINAKRYPRYTPRPKMEPWDAKYFTFLRY